MSSYIWLRKLMFFTRDKKYEVSPKIKIQRMNVKGICSYECGLKN